MFRKLQRMLTGLTMQTLRACMLRSHLMDWLTHAGHSRRMLSGVPRRGEMQCVGVVRRPCGLRGGAHPQGVLAQEPGQLERRPPGGRPRRRCSLLPSSPPASRQCPSISVSAKAQRCCLCTAQTAQTKACCWHLETCPTVYILRMSYVARIMISCPACCVHAAAVKWTSGALYTAKEAADFRGKVAAAAMTEEQRLAALRADERLPLVYLDVTIKVPLPLNTCLDSAGSVMPTVISP